MIEKRNTDGVEIRATKEENKNFIEGYASLYGVRSSPELGFIEIVEPGAHDKADITDVRMLNNHNSDMLLARTKNGTLTVTPDKKGLHFRGEVADTSFGRDLLVLVGGGYIDQASYAFRVAYGGDEWEMNSDGQLIRHILRTEKISDVSPTPYPAFEQTKVDRRSMEAAKKKIEDMTGMKHKEYMMRIRHLESLG